MEWWNRMRWTCVVEIFFMDIREEGGEGIPANNCGIVNKMCGDVNLLMVDECMRRGGGGVPAPAILCLRPASAFLLRKDDGTQ